MLMAITLAALAGTSAPIDEAASRYNELERVTAPVFVASSSQSRKAGHVTIPGWVREIGLEPAEAAAIVALAEMRKDEGGSGRRSWTIAEYAAGLALDTASRAGKSRDENAMPGTEPPHAANHAVPAAARYAIKLSALGSCTGALASALAKIEAARRFDPFTRFALGARQQMGSAMLPPDDSCLNKRD